MSGGIEVYTHLQQVISKFYQLALTQPLHTFKNSVFRLLAAELEADSGVWMTRAEQQIPFYEQDAYTLNLPQGFIEDYHDLSSVSQQVQQVFGVMLGCLGQTKDILDILPAEQWLSSDMYRLYCDKYNLYHSLMTVTVAPENQLMHIVTLARHDAQRPFSARDKQVKEFLVPNLCAALKLNILNGLQSPAYQHAKTKAVLDHYGNIIEAQPSFWALAQQRQLFCGGKLRLAEFSKPGIIDINGLRFESESANGLLYLHARDEQDLALSPRQAEIVKWVQQGLSNKQIAATLNITEATVKNHMKAILKATGSASRAQLIARLQA